MSKTIPKKKKGLTPKQSLFVRLSSLRKLAMHMGLIALPCVSLRIKKEELQRRIDKYGVGYISACVDTLGDKSKSQSQHIAAGVLLECFIPEWRKILPAEFIGRAARRRDKEVYAWKKAVLSRDNYICVKCGEKNKPEAHHIVRWVDAPSLRLDVDNGMTLCAWCHNKEHGKETHQQRPDICS